MHDYLQNCKPSKKNGTAYTLWEEIFSGVPQGSILCSLLFNIFLCYLFLTNEGNYLTSYSDDITPYAEEVVSELKAVTQKLFTWFAQ